MKKSKKYVSLILAGMMMLTMMPAYADETQPPESSYESTTEMETSVEPEDISETMIESADEAQETESAVEETATKSETPTQDETQAETKEASEDDTPDLMATVAPVVNLKAESAGPDRVLLSWTPSNGAVGYLVYGFNGNPHEGARYHYMGMTTSSRFYDLHAVDDEYNYYWVFPYVRDASGKMIPSGCTRYVFAKARTQAVTNLKSQSTTGGVRLTWTGSYGARGYLIYGIRGSQPYKFIGMTAGTTYTDANALTSDYNYYWVFPYHRDKNNQIIPGATGRYVYGKKISKESTYNAVIQELRQIDGIRYNDLPALEKRYPHLPWNQLGGLISLGDMQSTVYHDYYYAYYDVNKDGTNELLIGWNNGYGDNVEILTILTTDGTRNYAAYNGYSKAMSRYITTNGRIVEYYYKWDEYVIYKIASNGYTWISADGDALGTEVYNINWVLAK